METPVNKNMEEIIEALQEENKKLLRENRKLARELKHEMTLNKNTEILSEAKINLNRIIYDEKSRLEKYMNLLLNNCPYLILLFDSEGKIAFTSNSYLLKNNITTFAMIRGKSYRELLGPLLKEEILQQADLVFKNGAEGCKYASFKQDVDLEQEGYIRHYIIETTPMFNEAEQTEGAITVFYDITEIVRAKNEAEYARKIAEQSVRVKSEFLANMSHEIRTPINAIIGMTSIAKLSPDIEKKDYCLDKVEIASSHLLGVINDILDMSKIDANKLELSNVEFNFEKMLQKIVSVISLRVEEKHQDLVVHIDKHIPNFLIGDDKRLVQVITNLLSNAVKFTSEYGSIYLDTFLVIEEDNICTLQIEVCDNGIGISQEQQSRLFSSFEQADSSTSRKFGGTGLGLAISKRIVELMNGRIWIRSELGKGATFAFTAQMERGRAANPNGILSVSANWENIRVMVVDDSAVTCEYFEEIAESIDLQCDTVLGGGEACALIDKNGAYDIYFIDWQMPDMDGIELCKWIRGNTPDNSMIIMMSSAEWGAIEKEAKQAGVNGFLPKPLFPSSIIDCINECLGFDNLMADGEKQSIEAEVFKGYHILLVEDVEINREIVISLLEPTQIGIDCAENGLEAVNMLKEAPDKYDIIFMDIQMPEMDGYEATRNIRALESGHARQVPIVAMTANVFREDIEKCLAAGMNDHIGKPMDFDEVLAKLYKYL
ncbi:MAG: response regulator [Syntrophomonadaceae bacterium]|jgi:signal transduction histidine kinase/CheY-like chemotaxis protein|nr:response regulator [Syntrophomonadaceae bacterium]